MTKRPNILFIMTDEQRYDTVGYRNNEVITPNLDMLCRNSINFKRAYTTNPSCIPARAAIYSGRYPSQNGSTGFISPLNKHEKTFMAVLRDGGYYTAVTGKQHFWKSEVDKGYIYEDIIDEHGPSKVISNKLSSDEFSLPANKTYSNKVSSYIQFLYDEGFREGKELYEKVNDRGILKFTADKKYYVDEYVGNRSIEWLEENATMEKPWFYAVSFPGPHMPFDGIGLIDDEKYENISISIPKTTNRDLFSKPPHYLSMLKKYGEIDYINKKVIGSLTKEEIKLMKRAYFANMTLIDRKIGQILNVLKEKNVYDDTLIIFTSDHGDFMGDFGIATKAQYCSEALMRIPFLLKPPIKDYIGYEEEAFISSVDIAATCIKAANLKVPENISKMSLTAFYENKESIEIKEDIYMEARDIRAIREDRYKLIYYANREYGELYDLEIDPIEKYNLWDVEELKETRQRLIEKILDKVIFLGENMHIKWNKYDPSI